MLLIEDSAEALGSEYKERKCGTFGEAGVFAFYPNKQITTGEGGVLVTNNEELAIAARSMRSQGRGISGEWLDHDRLGYNYRMDELAAALGCSQMGRIEEILAKRAKVAEMYNQKLEKIDEVQIPYICKDTTKMSWFVYVIKLAHGIDREKVMAYLNQEGVHCKPYFTPIHLQPFYVDMFGFKKGDYPITEDMSSRTIALPFFTNLTEEQIDYVVEKLRDGIKIIN
jgi:perosamine synthetase